MTTAAYYPHSAIRSERSLALALGIPLSHLVETAAKANTLYRKAKPIVKPDGSIRQPWDARKQLKDIHRRIQSKILENVLYPGYLTGSLKGRSPRSNADLHAEAVIVVTEDVKGFFPSTSVQRVHGIWRGFFGFSDNVAKLLTALTTRDGELPQGAITSSYLANLAFWDREPRIVSALSAKGITYSRYVDDVTLSSRTELDNEVVTAAIGVVYGMMAGCGYQAKRDKHDVMRANSPMTVTKLAVNKRPALLKQDRSNIRTKVFQLENAVAGGGCELSLVKSLRSVESHVARLNSLHPGDARPLKLRVQRCKEILSEAGVLASRRNQPS